MKVKGKIIQIIKWEEKENYFFDTDYANKIVDLLHISSIDDGTLKWYEKTGWEL